MPIKNTCFSQSGLKERKIPLIAPKVKELKPKFDKEAEVSEILKRNRK